jgi:cyclopropane fatty-acyl-phospholipid synthase-like methyltransferase
MSARDQVLYRFHVQLRKHPDQPARVPLTVLRSSAAELDDAAFDAVLAELQSDGLLSAEGDDQVLPPARATEARRAWERVAADGFGTWMVASDTSEAGRAFHAATNQLGFVVFNVLDREQLDAAVRALALGPGQRALDLGSGIGTLTEHLASVTGAEFEGVDFAPLAVERARARCASSDLSVTFRLGSLDDETPDPGAWDAIMSFDTLYFVTDLPRLVHACLAGLRPGGRLLALFSATAPDLDSIDRIAPANTRLGRALTEAGAVWSASDFSAHEHEHWRREHQCVQTMEADFAREGSTRLWESRRDESARCLSAYEEGRTRRYLYVATAGRPTSEPMR